MKDHQLTLIWKTLKEYNYNNDKKNPGGPNPKKKTQTLKEFLDGIFQNQVSCNSWEIYRPQLKEYMEFYTY